MWTTNVIRLSNRLEARLMRLDPTAHWYLQVWRYEHAWWVMAIG